MLCFHVFPAAFQAENANCLNPAHFCLCFCLFQGVFIGGKHRIPQSRLQDRENHQDMLIRGHLTISPFSARIPPHQESSCFVSGQNSWNPCFWLKTPPGRDSGFRQNDDWVKNWLKLTVFLTARSQGICVFGGSIHPWKKMRRRRAQER